MHFVISIGSEFYVTFRGADLNRGPIDCGPLFQARRFQTQTGADTAAELLAANELITGDVVVKRCGLLD